MLRTLIGARGAKQSPLTREIQQARESGKLTASMHAVLGKTWMRCDRQIAKLERDLAPDAAGSFIDPDPEDNEND